ncbi:TLC domain-containing protein 2-like [Ruditapes philippinarum]|uniref:TLC domain-containing protein 2-like n=1 Tax=Ruditapes philippinarum TaxID=129788 RepID=UPI00295B3ADF|nr:TLC domain-containing protein 2-like [Ruditapes philippinarum]
MSQEPKPVLAEIWPTDISGTKYGITVATVSSLVFYLFSLISEFVTPNKIVEKQRWRWKNISVSLIHAIISGIWSVLCFAEEPKMMEDLIQTSTVTGHTLISASVGYFLYDSIDMLIYQRTRQSLELLLHHVVIISCFGLAILTKLYVGYAVLALVVELNSIFLHTRQLLQCLGFSRTNSFYRLNSLINLGTFLGFRILTLAWMTRWIVINKDLVPLVFYSMGSLGLAIMTVMNIILFYRLLNSDFLRKKESTRKEE